MGRIRTQKLHEMLSALIRQPLQPGMSRRPRKANGCWQYLAGKRFGSMSTNVTSSAKQPALPHLSTILKLLLTAKLGQDTVKL
jgi:hypothetical protein